MKIESIQAVLDLCEVHSLRISDLAICYECETNQLDKAEVLELMENNLQAMEQSVEQGLQGVKSYSGFTGGDAVKIDEYRRSGNTILGDTMLRALSNAVAVNEVNAAMGIICATPTAGSAGVVPAVLLSIRDKLSLDRRAQLNFLMTAGICGLVIGNNASISGARGGCQAEIGSASAMAAAATVEAAGGTPEQSAQALAIALMNVLGLACDPVAGLVEIPCIKRNAMGAANALSAAELALAGVKSRIPCDEVIEAMDRIGRMMPMALRETALGGLADTPTGRRLAKQLKLQKEQESGQ